MAYPQETGNLSLGGVRSRPAGDRGGLSPERMERFSGAKGFMAECPPTEKTVPCFLDLSAGVQGVPLETIFH